VGQPFWAAAGLPPGACLAQRETQFQTGAFDPAQAGRQTPPLSNVSSHR
jgi:hypothetical protein